jgi:GTP1/Obg family GTP-binding protein
MKDTPFSRQLFIDMSVAEQDAFLAGVRERRLTSLRKYEDMQRAKKLAKDEAARAKIDKLVERFEKQLAAVDKAYEKLEKIALDMQVLGQFLEQEAESGTNLS